MMQWWIIAFECALLSHEVQPWSDEGGMFASQGQKHWHSDW